MVHIKYKFSTRMAINITYCFEMMESFVVLLNALLPGITSTYRISHRCHRNSTL